MDFCGFGKRYSIDIGWTCLNSSKSAVRAGGGQEARQPDLRSLAHSAQRLWKRCSQDAASFLSSTSLKARLYAMASSDALGSKSEKLDAPTTSCQGCARWAGWRPWPVHAALHAAIRLHLSQVTAHAYAKDWAVHPLSSQSSF